MPAMSGMVVRSPRHRGNASDSGHIRSAVMNVPNYRHDTTAYRRQKDNVITGSGRNFSIQGSFLQNRAKYRECVGVCVSMFHNDTRVRHVD